MARRNLSEIYRRFISESRIVREIFNNQHLGVGAFEESYDFAREMSAIRLQDAWARFCRELIILSAYAEPFNYSGVRIARVPGLRSRKQVLSLLPSLFPSPHEKFWEPSWHIPHEAISAAGRLGIANYPSVSAAIGSTPSPLEELRQFRNFFAHRAGWRAQQIRVYISTRNLIPSRHIRDAVSFSVPPIQMINWIDQLESMALAAIK